MGRLRKAKIDSIQKLRQQGYTQAETAEKVGVHLKTVQKYDPLRKSKKTEDISLLTQLSFDDLDNFVNSLIWWIMCIEHTLMTKLDTKIMCPECGQGTYQYDKKKGTSVCDSCESEMSAPILIWNSLEERFGK